MSESPDSGRAISATVRSTKGGKLMQVYLAAPGGVDLSPLASVVRDLNWGIVDPDWGVGAAPLSPRDSIAKADAVILAGGVSSTWDLSAMMLEAGIAIGLNKPLLLIWDETTPLRHDLVPGYRITHISLSNVDALRFHVGLFLADVNHGARAPRPHSYTRETPVPEVRDLSRRLSDLQSQPASPQDFEKWIEDLFRAIGSKTVPTSDRGDRGFDIVVGVPVGFDFEGPILVEAKTSWPSPGQLQRVVERLDRVVASQQASRGIVVVLAKERSLAGRSWSWSSSRVAVLGADDLLRRVSTETSLIELFGPLAPAKRFR